METTDKPLTREQIISMQVIDAQGKLVGKVKDITISLGKQGVSLAVENIDGEINNIPWEDVQAASDFIILKPAKQKPQPKSEATSQNKTSQPLCPTCNKPLTWIEQYQRWYCYNDKKYV
jgi:sporulation protein YlmC with PRC-barrel domain